MIIGITAIAQGFVLIYLYPIMSLGMLYKFEEYRNIIARSEDIWRGGSQNIDNLNQL
jgi:hypothetical protein